MAGPRSGTLGLTSAVTGTGRAGVERRLDEAAAAATRAMGERPRGILIPHHGYACFTVALTDAVPFGRTREHQDCSTVSHQPF
jgi:hypothetical protein